MEIFNVANQYKGVSIKSRKFVNPYFLLRLNKYDKKNGIAVIYLIIKIGNDTAGRISTNVKCYPSEWNYRTKRVSGESEDVKNKNDNLDFISNEVHRIYKEFRDIGDDFTAEDIKAVLTKKPQEKPSFLMMFQDYIFSKKSEKVTQSTIQTLINHRKVFVDFLKINGKMDISFKDFGNNITDRLVQFIESKNCSNGFFNNAIYTYGAVFNRANKLGITNGNPLALVKRKKLKDKEFLFLNNEQLSILLNISLPSKTLQNSLNAYLFQCFTGLCLCDLKNFKKSLNIVNDKIIIARKKTKQNCYIPIVKQCRIILDRLKTDSFEIPFDSIYNNDIRIFATICEHPQSEMFTSHTGRKTYGMFLLQSNVKMETISKVLGHSDIRVTQKIYTRVFNQDIDRDFEHLL